MNDWHAFSLSLLMVIVTLYTVCFNQVCLNVLSFFHPTTCFVVRIKLALIGKLRAKSSPSKLGFMVSWELMDCKHGFAVVGSG